MYPKIKLKVWKIIGRIEPIMSIIKISAHTFLVYNHVLTAEKTTEILITPRANNGKVKSTSAITIHLR